MATAAPETQQIHLVAITKSQRSKAGIRSDVPDRIRSYRLAHYARRCRPKASVAYQNPSNLSALVRTRLGKLPCIKANPTRSSIGDRILSNDSRRSRIARTRNTVASATVPSPFRCAGRWQSTCKPSQPCPSESILACDELKKYIDQVEHKKRPRT